MQGAQVQSLVWEDSTCRGETKRACYICWVCALEPSSCYNWSPHVLESVILNKRSHLIEKPMHSNNEQPLLAATRENLNKAMKTNCVTQIFLKSIILFGTFLSRTNSAGRWPFCPPPPPFQETILSKSGITTSFILLLHLERGPGRLCLLYFPTLWSSVPVDQASLW